MGFDVPLFNLIATVFGMALGWLFKVVWGEVQKLQDADTVILQKVADLSMEVAANCIKRSELEKLETALFRKLDRIEDHVLFEKKMKSHKGGFDD